MILSFSVHFFIVSIGALLLFWQSTHNAIAFASGGLIVGTNFLMLAFAWSLIFKKKLIALAISLIVFKYAILGLIIYQLIKVTKVDLFWFSMGVASFAVSALVYAFVTTRTRN